MRIFFRPLLLIVLIVIAVQTTGCVRAALRDENRTLREQNDGLKRQLDEANGELRETKIALDRSQADLAASRSQNSVK